MSRSKQGETRIGFVMSLDAPLSNSRTAKPQSASRARAPIKAKAPELIDAAELPSDEQLESIWALAPESVREAFGYAGASKTKPSKHA